MNATAVFEPLSKLFRGDAERMHRALEIFERITRQDLERMDEAWAVRDWPALGRLAHRTKSGCLQIGETAAAEGLAAIELSSSSADETDAVSKNFAATRAELDQVIERVAAFLANKDGAGEK